MSLSSSTTFMMICLPGVLLLATPGEAAHKGERPPRVVSLAEREAEVSIPEQEPQIETLFAQKLEQNGVMRPLRENSTNTKEEKEEQEVEDGNISAGAFGMRFTKEVFGEGWVWKYMAALLVGSLMAVLNGPKQVEEDDCQKKKRTLAPVPVAPRKPTAEKQSTKATVAPVKAEVKKTEALEEDSREETQEQEQILAPAATAQQQLPPSLCSPREEKDSCSDCGSDDGASTTASGTPSSSGQSSSPATPSMESDPGTGTLEAEEVMLPPSVGAWRPRGAKSQEEKTVGEIKSILNKLTREKYGVLSEKLFGLITERKHVECVAKEVFEKATLQHHFIEMYADLCGELCQRSQASGIFAEKGGGSSFKRVLLDQCQASFERYLKRPAGLGKLEGEEHMEALVKYKTSMLGNVRLVGALLRRKMLSPKIIFLCTDELLLLRTEETLETLCAFLDAVCPVFDTPEWAEGSLKFCVIFDILNCIVAKGEFNVNSVRTKCLIQDLLDKKKSCWGQAVTSPKLEDTKSRSVSPEESPRTDTTLNADRDENWRARPSLQAPIPKIRDNNNREREPRAGQSTGNNRRRT